MTACPCGSERPCFSPMTRCAHPMRQPVDTLGPTGGFQANRPVATGTGGLDGRCVDTDQVSVHWWRNDDSGLCLCGKTRKRDGLAER